MNDHLPKRSPRLVSGGSSRCLNEVELVNVRLKEIRVLKFQRILAHSVHDRHKTASRLAVVGLVEASADNPDPT